MSTQWPSSGLQHLLAVVATSMITILPDLAAADLPLLYATEATAYNAGTYGERPAQSFFSTSELGPRVLVNTWEPTRCSPESHIFVTLSFVGNHTMPAILSAKDLSLVWIDSQYNSGLDLRLQQHNGSTYLTFYSAPLNEVFGGGQGMILDDEYQVRGEVQYDDYGDGHEFLLTTDGTALMMHGKQIIRDCSSVGGPAEGCELFELTFQELSVRTGERLFYWSPLDHLSLTESCRPYGSKTQGFGRGWDYLHANSVVKTKAGNYLMNARNICSMMLINGTTGDPIWQLGGAGNSFRDLSDGKATNFVGQHNAHFSNEDETEIIVFNNNLIANADQAIVHSPGCQADCSSARRIALDYDSMTAELMSEWYHPSSVQTRAKGGVQLLPGGSVLISWGAVPSLTEFHPDGDVCMELQFGPWSNSITGSNGLYRAYKFDYKATPRWDPSAAVVDNSVYVSWNGATEVDHWVLFGGMTESQMSEIKSLPRQGFETEFVQDEPLPLFVRVEARDVDDQTLRSTRTIMTTPIIRPRRGP